MLYAFHCIFLTLSLIDSQVSLRSIFMEDLLQPEDAKQRAMVISSSDNEPPMGYSCVSRSCPDMLGHSRFKTPSHSLPDHLETARVFGMEVSNSSVRVPSKNRLPICPCTPPPSPSGRNRPEQNLVLFSTLLVDPSAPNFESYYKSVSLLKVGIEFDWLIINENDN